MKLVYTKGRYGRQGVHVVDDTNTVTLFPECTTCRERGYRLCLDGDGGLFCTARCWRDQSRGYCRFLQQRRMERTIAARRRREARRAAIVCSVCGGPVEAARSSRRYCSDACRQRAYRERRAP